MTDAAVVKDLEIHVRASGRRLVHGVSLTIEAGERVGMIGESGSGKSLLALSIVGLLPSSLAASGSILLDGHEVVGAPERVLNALRGRAASVVFQEPLTALDPLTRVGKLIAEPLRRHRGLRGKELDAAVLRSLEEVALPDRERVVRAYPHEISGGQRQRVAIAMALACDPRLIIADEPTTALDVTVQAEIIELLRRIVRDRGAALLFVLHDIAIVSQIAEKIVVMKRGRIVETGAAEQIVRHPRDEYTRQLVDSAHVLDEALTTGELR